MGVAASSKQLVMKDVEGSKHLPKDAINYFQHASDGYLVFGKCVGDLSAKMDAKMTLHMNKKERAQFVKLEAEKENVVDEVGRFVGVEVLRYQRMKTELKPGVSLGHLFRNNTATAQMDALDVLLKKLTELRIKYLHFKEQLVEAMKNDGRASQKWWRDFVKWTAVLTGAAYAIFGVALLVCHFIPGVNFCLMGVEIALAAGLVVGGAAAALVIGMRQDEIDRATEYFDNIKENLTAMKETLLHLKNGNEFLNGDEQVEACRKQLDVLESRCHEIVACCGKARRL